MGEELLQLPQDIPRELAANSRIYKDECMFTFDTPANCENGLDIDLKTYQGFSRTATHNFTFENFHRTGNYLYLNIKKTLKPKSETDKLLNPLGEPSQKIQKLEIKDIKDEDFYDTTISVYNIAEDCYYSRDQLSAEFNRLIDAILTTNSSNRQQEITQWEQEIFPCDHSLDVEQFDIDGKVDLSKCSQCELTENLWICLHCGALGCGRSQYGSSVKGNSHALGHYELTGHPIAVKLGSLSGNEESCDAYCYQDNVEVKVLDLGKKLLKFGIDLNSAVKTEKSLVELNIDQNLNWEFKLDGANGEKLPPIFGAGLTGMSNLGNSCYINSVVQGLFNLPSYKKYFEDLNFPLDVKDPANDLLTQLIKLYDGLTSGRYSKPGNIKGDDYQLGIKPVVFKNLIGKNHPEFQTQKQQDAFEFLLYLLDQIDKKLGLKLNEALKFVLTNKVVCSNCKSGSINDELVDNIMVNIEDEVVGIDENGKKIYKEVKLIDCIKNLCAADIIEGYKCDNCNQENNSATKSLGFKSLPESLFVSVQRIKLENWVPVKVDVPIEIPYELDLASFPAPVFASDENELPKESKSRANEFKPNEGILEQLKSMGFPEIRCIKALMNTGNSNADEAMNWLLNHMEDVDIDEPITTSTIEKKPPSQEMIDNFVSMGFSTKLANKALHLHNNDPNQAIEWLFNNADDDGEIEPTPTDNTAELIEKLTAAPTSSKYKLSGVICHKGTSPHTGHYVVFLRKVVEGQEKWVLFNDEKVVVCDDNLQDIVTNAYIYIFQRN